VARIEEHVEELGVEGRGARVAPGELDDEREERVPVLGA
jgi:hypothetical protein